MTDDAFPARAVTIECAPGVHHGLSWERGALTLQEHDVESERALSALGADLPMCLEVLDAYRGGVGDPDILTRACNAPPEPASLLKFRDYAQRHQKAWIWSAGAPSRSVSVAVRKASEAYAHTWRVMLVGNLPLELRQAFVIDSVDAIERAGTTLRDFDVDELVRAQVGRPLWLSMQTWVRGADRDRSINVRGSLSKEGPAVTFWPGEVDVAVPLAWFSNVWARGLGGAPDGCFVLDVVDVHSPAEMAVRALRWRRTGGIVEPVVEPAVARLDAEVWRIVWDPPSSAGT